MVEGPRPRRPWAVRCRMPAPMGAERRAAERPLSERELEVLRAVARGMGNRQAADALHISDATVKRHLANVYPKLGARSRTEAVRAALTGGLIDPEELRAGPSEGSGPPEATTRWRCASPGCGCEVVVVRGSGSPSWRPFVCHGLPMVPVPPPDGRGG